MPHGHFEMRKPHGCARAQFGYVYSCLRGEVNGLQWRGREIERERETFRHFYTSAMKGDVTEAVKSDVGLYVRLISWCQPFIYAARVSRVPSRSSPRIFCTIEDRLVVPESTAHCRSSFSVLQGLKFCFGGHMALRHCVAWGESFCNEVREPMLYCLSSPAAYFDWIPHSIFWLPYGLERLQTINPKSQTNLFARSSTSTFSVFASKATK